MTKLLDKICKVRDLVTSKDYGKLKFYNMEILKLKEEINRQITKKTTDYSYQLDITSQDLRELAQDIRSLLKKWETAMSPEKNIKKLLKEVDADDKIDMDNFYKRVIPIMTARTGSIQAITEFLNIVEFYATFLYMVEEASNDKFALEYTERF